jgi:predicted TIM-barrel fold metal-dependent hydrolase
VDAHHHLWRANEGPHPGPAYLHRELLADIAGRNVIGSIYVEAGVGLRKDGPEELRGVGETEFAVMQSSLASATKSPIAGIIGGADLRLHERLEAVLDAHEAAGAGLFRGIRQRHDRSAPGPAYSPLTDPSVRPAIALLTRRDFTFDSHAAFSQLEDLAAFAQAAPDARIVLQHLGMPLTGGRFGPAAEVLETWRKGIVRLARCPNVTVKLGGIGMDSLYGMGWAERALPPTSDEVAAWWGDNIRLCIDSFGPSRCMFESNFPVDGEGLGYGVMWNAFSKIAECYSESERDDLFAGTAIRTYRLECLGA